MSQPWPIATASSRRRQVEEVLSHSHPYGITEAMQTALSRAREQAEACERAAVAAEIREAVERSGLSRADFASRIGTSASRLSTYTSGKVTPSATLMLRIRHAADRRLARARGTVPG
jgi:ribosome-binding protein aMBF1 (putative translation factor)